MSSITVAQGIVNGLVNPTANTLALADNAKQSVGANGIAYAGNISGVSSVPWGILPSISTRVK